jgi:hypothetical protein
MSVMSATDHSKETIRQPTGTQKLFSLSVAGSLRLKLQIVNQSAWQMPEEPRRDTIILGSHAIEKPTLASRQRRLFK